MEITFYNSLHLLNFLAKLIYFQKPLLLTLIRPMILPFSASFTSFCGVIRRRAKFVFIVVRLCGILPGA